MNIVTLHGFLRGKLDAVLSWCLAVSFFALGWFERHFLAERYLSAQTYEEIYYLPPAEWLPTFSLGYRAALADLLWMKGLVYFGNEIRHQGDVRYIYDYADAMLALDREFAAVYHWVGMGAIYRTGKVTVADVKRAASFLKRGTEVFPHDGKMAWDLGASLRYELVPLLKDPVEQQKAKREGLEYMQIAARLGDGPQWLAITNATELRRLGQAEQAARHLEEMYATTQDPETKKQIGIQLQRFRGVAYEEALKSASQDLERRRRQQFPYLDSNLFLLLSGSESQALSAGK